MRSCLLVVLIQCAFVGNSLPSLAADEPSQPNIVFILADDLGYGDLSCFGQQKFKTPHIDALAKSGMRFTQHYSGSTVCAPSRCALMTGMHTGHTPVRGNAEHKPEGQMPMPSDTYTIAHHLRDAGYKTGLFGKWGLGYPGSASDPLKMGFDRFYGYNCQRIAHCYYPAFLWNDDQRELLWGNVASNKDDYAPDFIHKQAIDFIRANKDQPFFCYYAAVQPHADMAAPENYMEKYRGKFLPEAKYEDGYYADQLESHAAFAAMVNVLDDYVGEVVAELEELGIAKNTLVVFSSDNGPHIEGGHDPEYFNSNGELKGLKRDMYDGGTRVPMIAAWPGKIQAGSESDLISAFWDFLPTFADIADKPLDKEIDGISILPTLLAKEGQKQHEYLYWEFPSVGGRIGIRKGKWKAVRYKANKHPNSPVELYDLSSDIGEQVNVASSNPQVAAELTELIKQAHSEATLPNFHPKSKSAKGK